MKLPILPTARDRRFRRPGRRFAEFIFMLAGAGVTAYAASADEGGALPFDLAFALREFPYEEKPAVSSDGARVAYSVRQPVAEGADYQGWYMPNGTVVTTVGSRVYLSSSGSARGIEICSSVEGNASWPVWSPDNRRLAFYSDADGSPQVWLFDVADNTCRKLSSAVVKTSPFKGAQAQWSPDGRKLYIPLDPNPDSDHSYAPGRKKECAIEAPTEPTVSAYSGSTREEEGPGDEEEARKTYQPTDDRIDLTNASMAAIDVGSGELEVVVDAETEPRPNIMRLSSSGRWISYRSVMYKHGEFSSVGLHDLVLVPSGGGPASIVVRDMPFSQHRVNYSLLDYRWNPVKDQLVYLKDGKLWLVDVGADGPSEPQQLAAELGELAPAVVYFSRDGRSVLVGSEPVGVARERQPGVLALVPLDGGDVTRIPLDLEKWEFLDVLKADDDTLWQPNRRDVFLQLRNKSSAETAIVRVNPDTGKRKTSWQGLARLTELNSGGSQKFIAGIYEDVRTAPDIYRFSADFSDKQRVSTIEPRLEGVKTGPAEVIETTIPLFDGSLKKVRTTLLLPPGAKAGDRLPGIVMVYSGADLSTRATFFGGGMGNTVPSLVFTSRGYAVIMANIELSPDGTPAHPIKQIVDTLLPQVYRAADLGYVDINRLAISGQSYGGYSTGAVISQTNLFRAAIPVNGVFDLSGYYARLMSDGSSSSIRWAETGQGRMGAPPWSNPQRYWDNSPFYRADKIFTPTLIVAGEDDLTVLSTESKKLFVALRRLERPVELITYAGEGHVISEWANINAADVTRRMVEFLETHLGRP